MMEASQDDVLIERHGRLGLITLNRPRALNALTLAMIRRIKPAMARWAGDREVDAVMIRGAGDKAFCAGGDVRSIVQAPLEEQPRLRREFFGEEYQLNYTIHRFPKPFIAFIDGITMGGGCGLSLHGKHVVATERTLLAMPETMLGLFPDVGATWFLNRLQGEMGLYLGLTGVRLGDADLLALRFARHAVHAAAEAEIVHELGNALRLNDATIDLIMERHARRPGPSAVAHRQAEVDRLFAGQSVEAIAAALETEEAPWAAAALKVFREGSPTSLKVAFRQICSGRGLTIDEMLAIEYRLALRLAGGHDFAEGVRAILIDKDNRPRWNPDSLAAVDAASVEAYFAPLVGEAELDLGDDETSGIFA